FCGLVTIPHGHHAGLRSDQRSNQLDHRIEPRHHISSANELGPTLSEVVQTTWSGTDTDNHDRGLRRTFKCPRIVKVSRSELLSSSSARQGAPSASARAWARPMRTKPTSVSTTNAAMPLRAKECAYCTACCQASPVPSSATLARPSLNITNRGSGREAPEFWFNTSEATCKAWANGVRPPVGSSRSCSSAV